MSLTPSIQYILTDIEGTTTSISFVYDILFPYFRKEIPKIISMQEDPEIITIIEDTKSIAKIMDKKELTSIEEVIDVLLEWSLEDKKITPLKTLQGILWKNGYVSGELKGNVFPDVAPALKKWKSEGCKIGVFSSGSVAAQKLIFGYSESGDLTPFFSHYFDTNTGGKRDVETYEKIARLIEIQPKQILFLSDIVEELDAAKKADYQTIQLVRPGTISNWKTTALSFDTITV